MKKNEFKTYLLAASYLAVKSGQEYVKEQLPFEFRFDVELNQSSDNLSADEFKTYQEDNGRILANQSVDDVVDLLSREDRVPIWIDINVKSCTKLATVLRLVCSGSYSDLPEKMYYSERGLGPFGIKSPYLPPGWREGKRFRIRSSWRRRSL